MPILSTTLTPGQIRMVIADNPDREKAENWLELSVSVQANDEEPLGIARLAALRAAQKLVLEEIEPFAESLRNNPAECERLGPRLGPLVFGLPESAPGKE